MPDIPGNYPSMRRRIFIRLSALGAAAALMPLVPGCKLDNTSDILSVPVLMAGFSDARSIAATGRAYIDLFPGENDSRRLKRGIFRHSTAGTSSNPATLKSFFEERYRDDFAKGRSLVVNGWVLSRTEARQCALYALTHTH
jgi:hypothetical protein